MSGETAATASQSGTPSCHTERDRTTDSPFGQYNSTATEDALGQARTEFTTCSTGAEDRSSPDYVVAPNDSPRDLHGRFSGGGSSAADGNAVSSCIAGVVWRNTEDLQHAQHAHPSAEDLRPFGAKDMVKERDQNSTPDTSSKGPSEYSEDNHIFRTLQRDKRNLVLDSVRPDLAPHIVITPPETGWDDYFIPLQNGVDPQYPYYLTVQTNTYDFVSEPYGRHIAPLHGEPMVREQSPNFGPTPVTSYSPRPVFSPSRFVQLVERSSTERMVMYHVFSAVQRLLRRCAALTVANKALSFRQRYDTTDVLQILEKTFRWSDPAEPFLHGCKYHKGTTIIESDWPCTVPHIIINEPPPHNPWISWYNATTDPQDFGYGFYLTVPSRLITFQRHPSEYDCEGHLCLADSGSEVDRSEIDSPLDTSLPDTPNDCRYTDAFGNYSQPINSHQLSQENLAFSIGSSEFPSAYYGHPGETEEEELPPLDGWCEAYLQPSEHLASI